MDPEVARGEKVKSGDQWEIWEWKVERMDGSRSGSRVESKEW